MLTKEQILLVTDKATKQIEVPEWGGSVFIRGMTIDDADYVASIKDDNQIGLKIIVRMVVDENGKQLFTDKDIPALKKKSIRAITRVVRQITDFSSLDTAEGNSESTTA